MKTVKSMLKAVFWLLIIALLVAPLGLIYEISLRERAAYQAPSAPVIREGAMGAAVEATRQDVAEYIRISGVFTSREVYYIELTQKKPEEIRWDVAVGDEIQTGQKLGHYNGEEILSEVDGILLEIAAYGTKPYLKVRLLSELELECNLSDKVIKQLRRAENLVTKEGNRVSVAYVAKVKNDDGTSRVLLKIDSSEHFYGERVKDFILYTGYVYTGALVLPDKCLYQKNPGDDQPWYVRQVTEDGYFLEELEVQRGYSNGDLVCVTGIEEGTFYDNGYQIVAGDQP